MEIKIRFGTDFEFRRVKNILAKLGWYKSQGYEIRLPKGVTKESAEEETKSQITKEFNEEKYKEVANQIDSGFLKIEEQLSKKLKETFNENIPKIFLVYLTNYGSGGSYNLPNIIVFNMNNKNGIKTVIHEIIHLIIENKIQKYKIQHWEKERIVDLILNSREFDFLGYNHWQGSYDSVGKYVDKLFNNWFFKNPEDFFSKIESVRQSAV